jgi:PAS domain S-box-containing protein
MGCVTTSDFKDTPAQAGVSAAFDRLQVLETVLDESTDPIFCILEDGTYRYVNRAFTAPFAREPEEVIGLRIYDLFSLEEAEKRMTVVRRAFASAETIVFEVRVPMARGGDHFYLTSVKPIQDAGGRVVSVVCISKDITDRKRVELEREQVIRELQTALAQVRTLSGLLPICSSCKNIRDDKGYWIQIEEYVRCHTEADFTHGICPDCRGRLYPETI